MTEAEPALPANGADPTGQPAPVTQPTDYDARIRSDPEFAVDQVKKMKSENTKLFQKQKSYEAITAVADQLGGAEPARQFIYEYDSILKHPDVKRVVDHYRANGVLPTTSEKRPESNTEFDEMYPDPQAQELTALRTKVNQLEQQVSQTRGAVGKQQIGAMLSHLKTEYPDGFDEYLLPALSEQFSNWDKTSQGRDLLATLNYDHLKTIAGRAFMDNRDAIYERIHERKLDELKRGATGAPAGNLSTGREMRPHASNKSVSALEALREFEAANGPITRR